jgi:integrase/recombinase XerD
MERFFTHAETLSSKREGPLGLYIDEFAEQLSRQGYSRQYARRRLQLVAELSHWLRRRDLAVADLTLTHLENYLRFRARSRRIRPGDAASLKVFFELLHQKGLVIAQIELVDKTPIDELQDEFRLYLRQERVLAPSTVIHYASFAKELLQHRFGIGPADLSLLSAADVVGFVQRRASSLVRKTAKLMTTALRSFLRYARYRDYIRVDLAACVPCVADWSAASLPKSLPLQHVKRVLASCNRKTAIGRRDYAMLLLLARLGLRAGEVVSLALDDIDWEAGYLTVRGKGDRRAPLPLPADVGKAIAAYLKYGRPRSTSRCVFLRGRAPASSFKSSPAVSTVVRHALARAGIDSPRKGAHQFRHTLATEMLRQGASLREIGDLLRHRPPQTTTIYAKVDLVSLRTLGLAWPGGAR